MKIPNQIQGQKYILLSTFRRNGQAVSTPLWFAERDDKIIFSTRNDSGKYKRLRNNSKVTVAPCNIRGKITGPQFAGTARVLPVEQWPEAKRILDRKYWLRRLPVWSKHNEYLEVEMGS